MKATSVSQDKQYVHFVPSEFLNPTNPIPIDVIGAGGTGSNMVAALGKINDILTKMHHAGLSVRVFDDDVLQAHNTGRQYFPSAETGMYKSVACINRVNRFFGTNWKAVTEKYDKKTMADYPGLSTAAITISCVDDVDARFEIAQILSEAYHHRRFFRNRPIYWMDYGNSRYTGQVIFSTVGKVTQPESKKYIPVSYLPLVTDEYRDLLKASPKKDNSHSCSLLRSLQEQDLFINSALADLGGSFLMRVFQEGILFERGFFFNLRAYRLQPIKITGELAKIKPRKYKTAA